MYKSLEYRLLISTIAVAYKDYKGCKVDDLKFGLFNVEEYEEIKAGEGKPFAFFVIRTDGIIELYAAKTVPADKCIYDVEILSNNTLSNKQIAYSMHSME